MSHRHSLFCFSAARLADRKYYVHCHINRVCHVIACHLSARIASADGFAVRCFGNAYATFASKYGAPIVVHVTEDERASRKWRDVLKEFTQEWPEVTQRFQVTAEEWKNCLSLKMPRESQNQRMI